MGVAVVADGVVVAEGLTLIDPETAFDPYCTAVNGLDERAVQGAPTLPQVWPALTQLLDGQLFVVAHNAGFDMGVMRNAGARYGVTTGPGAFSGGAAHLAHGQGDVAEPAVYSLGYVAPLCGVDFDHHQAGQDVELLRFGDRGAVPRSRRRQASGMSSAALRVVPGRMTSRRISRASYPRPESHQR